MHTPNNRSIANIKSPFVSSNSDDVHYTSNEENDYPRTEKVLFQLIKGTFDEPDLCQQALLLN